MTALCGVLAKAYACYKSAIPALVAALVLLLILDLTGAISPFGGRRKARGVAPKPAEFMYLDSARVGSYLDQVTGGDVERENLQETTTENTNLGLELNTVGKADASTGSQLTRNIVVTQTAADHFQTLQNERKPEVLDAESCSFAAELDSAKVHDGTIVKIEHALVEIPPYLSVYPELRYAKFRLPPGSSVFGEVPLASFYQVDESVRGTPRKERNTFKKRVGPNPRIPFSLSAAGTAKSQPCKHDQPSTGHKSKSGSESAESQVTVVLPARFANLTGDPSLLAVQLTIVGIVVANHKHGFGDGTSLGAYWPALSTVQAPLLRELGVRASVLKKKRIDVRKELFNAVARTVTFPGHVVEVIPIAMYD